MGRNWLERGTLGTTNRVSPAKATGKTGGSNSQSGKGSTEMTASSSISNTKTEIDEKSPTFQVDLFPWRRFIARRELWVRKKDTAFTKWWRCFIASTFADFLRN